ncbi:MAG TPA: sigma-70 family RNA polymerase sigma factor [Steroidobacteraceae bacterium]|nr:sigma-70 family RNA polymerase sigma factor [Steroidobacteraceae bacterium]
MPAAALMHACVASDEELMERFQRDLDYSAFEQLFRRQRDDLLRFLSKLLRDRTAAADACQQAWLKVIEVAHAGNYRAHPDSAFRAWLFTVARNLAIDQYQRKFAAVRTVPLADDWETDAAADDPVEGTSREQMAQRLNAAVRRLPREQRDVIALWAAGTDPAAIAVMVQAPRETVFSRKKYAIAKLRIALCSPLLARGAQSVQS